MKGWKWGSKDFFFLFIRRMGNQG